MNLLDSDGDERSEKFDLNFVLETQKKSQQLIDSTAEFEAEMRDLAEKRKKKAADEAKVKSSLQAVIVSLQLELNSVKEQNTILRAQVASLKETQLVDRTVSKDKAVSATTDPETPQPVGQGPEHAFPSLVCQSDPGLQGKVDFAGCLQCDQWEEDGSKRQTAQRDFRQSSEGNFEASQPRPSARGNPWSKVQDVRKDYEEQRGQC
ncbi:hypothetical protein IWX49DRAFT_574027 [Phyllosticta citricarpa]